MNNTDKILLALAIASAMATAACSLDTAATLDGPEEEDFAQVSQSLNGLTTGGADIAYSRKKDVYLAVWHEGKSGDDNIAGAILKTNGSVLAGPFFISKETGNQSFPRVASDGTDFFVTWQDGRNGNLDIYGSRVKSNGSVVHPSGVTITAGSAFSTAPDIAFSAGDYMVVWADDRNGGDLEIFGSRVDPGGTVLDPAGVLLSNIGGPDVYPAIEGNGDKFLVGWSSLANGAIDYDIMGRIVKTNGGVAFSGLIPIGTSTEHEFKVSIASDGEDFCTVWQNGGLPDAEINTLPVSEAGTPGGLTAIPRPAGWTAIRPSVTFIENRYMAAWTQHPQAPNLKGELRGQRLAGCDPTGANFLINKLRSRDTGVEIASDGSSAMSAWTDLNPSGNKCLVCGDVRDELGNSLFPEFPIR